MKIFAILGLLFLSQEIHAVVTEIEEKNPLGRPFLYLNPDPREGITSSSITGDLSPTMLALLERQAVSLDKKTNNRKKPMSYQELEDK